MSKIEVVHNPLNIGNGVWTIGRTFNIISETSCFYVLDNGSRINKKHMSVAGTACGEHSVKVKLLN